MVNPVGNNSNNVSGIGIYCNVIDPSKLPPDHPILQGNMPNCTVVGPCGCGGGACYPPGYYLNNYAHNTVKRRVTVLTDELIKNLDECLDSEDPTLRTSAANTIVKLFGEDVTRGTDEGLNILVNKMLMNPYDKSVRGHALDLLNTNMASGNADTKMILEAIQQDPTAIDRHRDEAKLASYNIDTKTKVVNAPVTTGGTVIS